MAKKLLLNFIAIAGIFQIAFALPAEDIQTLNNRDYYQVVEDALSQAKDSIYIIMYSMRYYQSYYSTPTNDFIQALSSAQKRGVKVKVILEQSKTFGKDNSDKNHEAGELLKNRGIEVYYDSPFITTHSKLIVIDRYITIIGSTNWSYYALCKNNESSVLIKSKQIAEAFIQYFNLILEDCQY